jgi:hypothetical protein
MGFTEALLPYVAEMPPTAALHHGILIGMLFGETLRKSYRAYLNRKTK